MDGVKPGRAGMPSQRPGDRFPALSVPRLSPLPQREAAPDAAVGEVVFISHQGKRAPSSMPAMTPRCPGVLDSVCGVPVRPAQRSTCVSGPVSAC